MSTPLKNRDEVKTAITALTAIHTEPAYKDTLGEQIADNLMFRKKVVATDSGSGSKTVDFASKDFVELTASGNITIAFTGVEVGEEKILKVSKSGGVTVAFSGAEDQTPNAAAVSSLTSVYYKVYRVDSSGNIVVEPLSKVILSATEEIEGILEVATEAEMLTGTADNKTVTPGKISATSGLVVFSAYISSDGTINDRPSAINNLLTSITKSGDDYVLNLNTSISESTWNNNYMINTIGNAVGSRNPTYEWTAATTVILRFRDSSGNVQSTPFQLEIKQYT